MTTVPYSFVLDCVNDQRAKRWGDGFNTTGGEIPYTLADKEAVLYNSGLPSIPRLLARAGPIHQELTHPQGYRIYRQLGVVVNHQLNSEWEFQIAPRVQACLDELQVKWTSLDIVRIGAVDHPSTSPVTLWIGAQRETLDSKLAKTAACKCLEILESCGITDVNVDIRQSSVFRSAGPQLLTPKDLFETEIELDHPLTHALGLNISPLDAPSSTGTGSLFMALGDSPSPLLLVTARHVVFPPSTTSNDEFDHRNLNEPRYDILLLGDKAYSRYLSSIRDEIGSQAMKVETEKESLTSRSTRVKGRDETRNLQYMQKTVREIEMAEEAMGALYDLFNDVQTNWSTSESRILGRVVYSPPLLIGAGAPDEQYTEDYAIIEIDEGKIDRTKFNGNAIELGRSLDMMHEFHDKMNFELQGTHSRFPYGDGFLKLEGTISPSEMRRPAMLDKNGDPCIIVLKRGSATDTTIGRASGIMSFVREYSNDGSHRTSKEWPILPFDQKSGAFSAQGDSGAVVVDGLGRIGGIITGGSGKADELDITYVTPIEPLLKSIRRHFPDAHFNVA